MKKKVKISKFERLIYTLAVTLVLMAPISIVFSKATLSKLNFEVEEKKQEIAQQQKKERKRNYDRDCLQKNSRNSQ